MSFLKKVFVLTFLIILTVGIAAIVTKSYAQDPQTEYQKKLEEHEKEKARIEAENKKKEGMLEDQKRINAAKRAYKEGRTYLQKGMAEEALKSYELAIQYDNSFASAYHGKGIALAKLRRYDDALNAYHKSIQLDPLYADGYLALAKQYRQMNKFDEALTMCLKAIEADTIAAEKPDSKDVAAAYYELGFVYNQRKDFEKAARAFGEAGKLHPKYFNAFNAQGTALEKIGKSDEAIAAYQQAVEVKPDYYEAWARLAALYNKLTQNDKALDAALNSLKYKKNYGLAAFEAGTAYKSLGEYNNAIQYFEIALLDKQWTKNAQYEIDMIKRKNK